MSRLPSLITADELFRVSDDGMRRELLAGVVRVMEPAGFGHGRVAAAIGGMLSAHVREHRLGVVLAAETGFVLATDPDTVRAPDAAFVRRERVEALGETSRFWPEAPDLAVEVISPHDAFSDVEEKALAWICAGTRLVLVADPRRRTITAYRARGDVRIYDEGETIDASAAVAGWSLVVADAFI
jgi:Uma2 family endonuclease